MNYFNFKPATVILNFQGIVDGVFFYTVKNDYLPNLHVRPMSDSGVAFIYDSVREKWFSQFDATLNLPIPTTNVRIKVVNPVGETVNVWFDVIDVKTQKTNSTPKVSLKNHSLITTEINRLNTAINRYSTVSSSESTSAANAYYISTAPPPKQDNYFVILIIVVFAVCIFVGVLYELKMLKWRSAKKIS